MVLSKTKLSKAKQNKTVQNKTETGVRELLYFRGPKWVCRAFCNGSSLCACGTSSGLIWVPLIEDKLMTLVILSSFFLYRETDGDTLSFEWRLNNTIVTGTSIVKDVSTVDSSLFVYRTSYT